MRHVTLLWHREEPVGICVFTSPALSLQQRNKFFGLSGKWSRARFQALNRQVLNLSRVVLHPSYRGAGIASEFIRRSCQSCSTPWIETLAQMGRIHPFFEKAGFVRVGASDRGNPSIESHSALYGVRKSKHGKKRLLTEETYRKSRHASPVYYVFDNRTRARG